MFVYGTYVLQGEEDANLEFIPGTFFTRQRKQLLQANDKLYEDMVLPTKNIRSSTEHRDHQANKQVHDEG